MRKKLTKLVLISVGVLFLAGCVSNNSSTNGTANSVVAPVAQNLGNNNDKTQIETNKSLEQKLEDKIKLIVKNFVAPASELIRDSLSEFTDFSFKSMETNKTSKIARVDINVDDHWKNNEAYFMRGSGNLSSSILREFFQSSLPINQVAIRYYGNTGDRYGNIKNGVIMSYLIDRATFKKINWDHFNKYGLCPFLMEEESIDSNNSCVYMFDVQ